MKKPNLERIAKVIAADWVTPEIPILPNLNEDWGNIVYYSNKPKLEDWEHESASYFAYSENELLINLLKEHSLENLNPDFQFLAYLFVRSHKAAEHIRSIRGNDINQNRESKLELLLTLKLLIENKNGISINFIRKQRVCGSVVNSDLIQIIKAALFDHFEKTDTDIYVARMRPELIRLKIPEQIEDWEKYIDLRIEQEKALISQNRLTIKKDVNWYIKQSVYHLWEYLQKYTQIKTSEGSEYSNEQGRFIFRFLEIIGLIDNQNKIIKKEDVVGYYLKTYKKEIPMMPKFGPVKKFKHQ